MRSRARRRIRVARAQRLIWAALLGIGPLGAYADEVARGDSAWRNRAAGERGERPLHDPIRQAIRSYEARVPLLSGWVDRHKAIPLIERAYAIAPANPGNRLLLALTLLDLAPERRVEALDLLKQVEGLTPRPSMRIEDLVVRRKARERLVEGGAA